MYELADPLRRPSVLVLMAARNGSAWIFEQIESILQQRHVDIDLVISDDGSTDDTREKVLQFSEADARVRMVSPLPARGSAAQNFLWLLCNAQVEKHHQFVALSDQDDAWHREKLHHACYELQLSGAAGYSCAVTAYWSNGRETTLRQVSATTRSDFLFEGAGQGCTFVFGSMFHQNLRNFFLQHPECTTAVYYHDWLIYALARSWQKKWHFDEKTMMRYRQHQANDTGARASLSGLNRRFRRIRNGWYLGQLRAIARVCAMAAPGNQMIEQWNAMLLERPSLARRIRIVAFCLRGGRRRRSDNLILIAAAGLGWI